MAGRERYTTPMPVSPCYLEGNAMSRASSDYDLTRLSRYLTPLSSPQGIATNSTDGMMPGRIDPPDSPLDLVLPITTALTPHQWHKRVMSLINRYLRERGSEEEIDNVERAFETLELFCVNDDAKISLRTSQYWTQRWPERTANSEVLHAANVFYASYLFTANARLTQNFKSLFYKTSTFAQYSPTPSSLTSTASWTNFPTFLNEAFHLARTHSSSPGYVPSMRPLTEITQRVNKRQPQTISQQNQNCGGLQPRTDVEALHDHSPVYRRPPSRNEMAPARDQPRYMTPTVASQAQSTSTRATSRATSRPSTPSSAESFAGRSKGFLLNAGRRLGLNNPKARTIPSPTNEVPAPPTPPKPTAACQQTTSKHSSPDKPLPSLPVATIHHRSPAVRRSLIDAKEKPLRRSVSPSPNSDEKDEWPALQPSRYASPVNLPRQRDASAATVTQAMTKLNISEDTSQAEIPATGTGQQSHVKRSTGSTIAVNGGGANNSLTASTGTPRALELLSGQKPLLSMSHISSSPSQAKVSPYRDSSSAPREPPRQVQVPTAHRYSPQKSPRSPKIRKIPQPLSIPGPVRSNRRARRHIGVGGSPYGKIARASFSPKIANSGRYPVQSVLGQKRAASAGSGKVLAIKQPKLRAPESRNSSIALHRESVQSEAGAESEADLLFAKPRKRDLDQKKAHANDKAEEADIDTDRETLRPKHKISLKSVKAMLSKPNMSQDQSESFAGSNGAASSSHLKERRDDITHSEHLSSMIRPECLSSEASYGNALIAANDSDVGLLRQFDGQEHSDYRVKRISVAAPQHGPTLRISNAAEKVLLGASSDEESPQQAHRSKKRHSISDMRRSTVLKEQLKKGTETLRKASLPVSRSITSSLSKYDPDFKPENGVVPIKTDYPSTNDPFIENEEPGLHDSESCGVLGSDGNEWPLTLQSDTICPELKTVLERQSEDEDSWISPMNTAAPRYREGSDAVNTSTIVVPNNTPASAAVSAINVADPTVQARAFPASESSKELASSRAGKRDDSPFPLRTSSRQHFQSLIRENSMKTQTLPTTHLSRPEIPNRFASKRSSSVAGGLEENYNLGSGTGNMRASDTATPAMSTTPTLVAEHTPHSSKHLSSSKKAVLNNIRGLFHKRSGEHDTPRSALSKSQSVKRSNALVAKNGSTLTNINTPVPPMPMGNGTRVEAGEADRATQLAMEVLDRARSEPNAVKKAQLIQLGKVMVKAVTSSRDAEKSMEEAKQAAAKAEIHNMETKRALWQVTDMVEALLQV